MNDCIHLRSIFDKIDQEFKNKCVKLGLIIKKESQYCLLCDKYENIHGK